MIRIDRTKRKRKQGWMISCLKMKTEVKSLPLDVQNNPLDIK